MTKNDSESIEGWMKTHTIDDCKDLANEMASDWEDITQLVEVIHELEEIQHEFEDE